MDKDIPKVLYLVASGQAGGAERATMMMIKHHHRYLPELLLFTDGPLRQEAVAAGIPVRVLKHSLRLRRPLALWRAQQEILAHIRASGCRLVHSCMSYPHLVGAIAAFRAKVPAVLYQHGPVGHWTDRAASCLPTASILVNSDYTRIQQAGLCMVPRSIELAPLATDFALSESDKLSQRKRVEVALGLKPSDFVIGMVARFDPWKGIDFALKASAPLLRRRPDLRFLVIGGQYRHFFPHYEQYLKSLAHDLGIDGQTVFAGYQADVRAYVARLDVAVHASLSPEPFGLSVLECMALGVPVVCANEGGILEFVRDRETGLLFAARDNASLGQVLESIVGDASLRLSLAHAALDQVDGSYRPKTMITRLEEIYDNIIKCCASA